MMKLSRVVMKRQDDLCQENRKEERINCRIVDESPSLKDLAKA